MEVKQLIPCTDWFYVADSNGQGDVITRLAAWAVTESNGVVGLIADEVEHGIPELVAPPSDFPATYKHLRELTELQHLFVGEKYPKG